MPKPEFAVVECEPLRKAYHWCSFAEFLSDSKKVVGFIQCQLDQPFLIALWDAESGRKLKVVDAIPYAASSDSWISPDGGLLAITTYTMEADRTIGKTFIVDTATLEFRVTLPHRVEQAAFSRDGQLIAIVDDQKNVRVLKAKGGAAVASLKVESYLNHLAFRDSAEELLIVQGSGPLLSWNFRTNKKGICMKSSGCHVALSSDGKTLATFLGKGLGKKGWTVERTDTTSWKSEEFDFPGDVRHCSLSPDGSKLAVAADKELVVWDFVEDCAWFKWKKPHYGDIRHAAFSPDGQRLACIMNHGQVHIFDFRTGAMNQVIQRPKPKAGELQCLEMVGPDDVMDRVDGHLEPLNPLPVVCPACKRVDLDFVHSPYVVGKKIESPVDFAPAVAGNLLVRESMKRVLEVAAPGTGKFYPTIHRKTKQPTPWFLAVLQHTQTTSEPSAKKCSKCREPREWTDVMETTSNPISKHEVFKARNWWGDGDRRNLYFSVRLEALVKKLGLRGMVRSSDCKQTPTQEDLAWAEQKFKIIQQADAKAKTTAKRKQDDVTEWFSDYLKRNAKKKPVVHDFAAAEKKLGVKLPETYKQFMAVVGTKKFKDLDGEEEFNAHILSPEQLKVESCLERGDDEEAEFKGLLFAVTEHGDAFYFDLTRNAPDYEIRKHDHEVDSCEPYAKNFAEAIKRFAAA
jgi:WD40 repeat protein